MVDADGVHVGQDDLPVGEVRRLLGKDKIVGLSTHSPKQAEDAVRAGADYIGVGPIFATKTKDDVCDSVGFSYLDWVVENISLPFVAIGGIKQHNIEQIAYDSLEEMDAVLGRIDEDALLRSMKARRSIR